MRAGHRENHPHGHGYKVICGSAGMLIYVTNRLYDPKDEGRIQKQIKKSIQTWRPDYWRV